MSDEVKLKTGVLPDTVREVLNQSLSDTASQLNSAGAIEIPTGSSARVIRVNEYFLKIYPALNKPGRVKAFLSALIGRSSFKPEIVRANAQLLTERGFSTLSVIATGSLPNGQAFLVSHNCPGVPLGSLFAELTVPQRWALIKSLAAFVRRLHGLNITHGDLNPSNLLVNREEAGWQFTILDLEQLRRRRVVRKHTILRELSQLNFYHSPLLTPYMRRAFLRGYLHQSTRGERVIWMELKTRYQERRRRKASQS